jgi:flagellar M-ring protein FliF
VNFDSERGDSVEVVNIPFETPEWPQAAEAKGPAGWLALLEQSAPYVKPALIGLFLMLTFLFGIRPLVRWLTERSMGEVEIVKQLPKTVGELEHELSGVKSLPSLNQASMLVASDSDASLGAMRSWLNEKS